MIPETIQNIITYGSQKENQITIDNLYDIFAACNEVNNHKHAVIVFSQSNWKEEYPVESRSYIVYSDNWGWDPTKIGRRRSGSALDASDIMVRLDYYNWDVDYCYMISEEQAKEINHSILSH